MKNITWCGKDLLACDDGAEWFLKQKDHGLVPIVKAAIIGGKETMLYANWGIVRIMTHKQRVLYACYAARQVIKIFEDKYPEDKRPRLAIEAAEKWVGTPTEENRVAAYAAADAAYADAAYADAAYAYAAYAAAYAYAAYAAAYAAYAAADAAYAAADAADADAAKMRAKILRYGVKILLEDKGEK